MKFPKNVCMQCRFFVWYNNIELNWKSTVESFISLIDSVVETIIHYLDKKTWHCIRGNKRTDHIHSGFNEIFELFTDTTIQHLGADTFQHNLFVAFFSRRLSTHQIKYPVTELELLFIVVELKECKTIFWGQCINVYILNVRIYWLMH